MEPENILNPTLKRNLFIYLLVSAISFSILVASPQAGVSVPVFMLLQAAGLFFFTPRRRQLLILVPIFILALNAFISANPMWRIANLVVAAVLYALMAVYSIHGISLKDTSPSIFARLINAVHGALSSFSVPVAWGAKVKFVSNLFFIKLKCSKS